ncbi:MAG: N-acetyltransferase [Promethearchaeota archaeon]|nr:MAG: N-acetyltransferase [Candidatus Lokiarchaeota archaeon]
MEFQGDFKMDESQISIHTVTEHDFPLIERLFVQNGACEGCWCMYWRVDTNKQYKEGCGNKNKNSLKKLVKAGQVRALIAMDGDEPAGWCTFGPRESFRRLKEYRTLKRESHFGLWSIVCFFTNSKFRRKGISNALLEKAVEACFAQGATEIEGYPTEMKEKYTYTYTGITTQFERLGFKHMVREGEMRPIYVLKKIN